MPATAGRVPMPRGNRVDTSASLKTTGIWANTIGYDPYAPTGDEPAGGKAATQNMYEKSKDLMAAARLTGGVEVDASRGLWKGAGRLKGYHAPGRGAPSDLPLAPPSSAEAAADPRAEEEEDESDGLSTSSDSERRRKERKEKKRKHKSHKHKSHKKRRGSDREDSSDEEDGSKSDERRKKRKHKHKHRRRDSSSRSE